jgi:hypothetical protein
LQWLVVWNALLAEIVPCLFVSCMLLLCHHRSGPRC